MLAEALDLNHAFLHFGLAQPQNQRNAVLQRVLHLPLHLGVVRVGGLGLDAHSPEVVADLEALSYQVLADLGNVDLGFSGPDSGVFLHLLFEDGEDALDADGDTHGRDLFAWEHTYEAVIATAASDGADAVAGVSEDGFIYEACVVVQASG